MTEICKIEGCEKRKANMKMCSMHYMRFHVHGDPHYSYDAPEQVHKRFWARVDKITPHGPWGTCWRYTGRLDRDGYGLNTASQHRYERRAHRFSYVEHKGEIPKGLVVRHHCDTRDCVNPDHLEVGTNSDNMRDRVEHGVCFKGSGNPRAKLTEADVLDIRLRIEQGERKAALSREFKVSDAVISSIFYRQSWSHI